MTGTSWKFILYGETPAKKNSKVWNKAKNLILPGRMFAAWHESALFQLGAFRRPQSPLVGPVSVRVAFVHGDRRRRDSDNGLSSVMDLLVDAGVLSDDKWTVVRELTVRNDYVKNAARCEIDIIPFQDSE